MSESCKRICRPEEVSRFDSGMPGIIRKIEWCSICGGLQTIDLVDGRRIPATSIRFPDNEK